MNKEDINLINFALVWSNFISNILFLITNENNFKDIIIIEIIFTPFMYILFYLIKKGVKK